MAEQYITKAHRQHNSMVTTIPIAVRERLGLLNGDHIVWQVSEDCKFVQVFKATFGVKNSDDLKRNFGE